jgi:hypothetical protein
VSFPSANAAAVIGIIRSFLARPTSALAAAGDIACSRARRAHGALEPSSAHTSRATHSATGTARSDASRDVNRDVNRCNAVT